MGLLTFSKVSLKISSIMCARRALSTSSSVLGAHINLIAKDNVAIIKFNSPGKVNVLNESTIKEAVEIFDEVAKNDSYEAAVILSGKPTCFIAGADINMLQSCKTIVDVENLGKSFHDILFRIENSKKPYVAAIMGSCLGGGLEVALACRYRVAVKDKSTLALPEVLLGILPGGGGTQRLPRLVGLPNSLDVMLTGRNVPAVKAKKIGLVDQLVNPLGPGLLPPDVGTLEYLEDISVRIARNLANGSLKVNRSPQGFANKLMSTAMSTKYVKDFVFKKAHKTVMKQTNGLYPAPLKILEVVRKGLDDGIDAGYKAEIKGFGELGVTSEARGLMSLFNGQTECKKNNYGTPVRPTKTIAILGAGLMGAGIAQVSIDKGYRTILKDMNDKGLGRGLHQVQVGLDKSVKQKKLLGLTANKYMSNLTATLDYQNLSNADIVIEAVFEDLKLKHKIIQDVENYIPEHCVFASNTSALPIAKLSEASKHPEKLLEIIVTDKTSKDTIAVAVDVGLKQGKTVIVVKDGPGFYTTRILVPMMNEVFRLLLEGVEPKKLDKLSKAFGFPVGSVTLTDEVGLDVGVHITKFMKEVLGERLISGDTEALTELVNKGCHGRKSGKGIFIYEKGTKDRNISPEFTEIAEKYKLSPKGSLADEDIQYRLATRFINEAVLCLQEGIIRSPLEGDIGAVFGLGFPPFSGGPFHFIDSYGADKLVSKMRGFEASYGICYTPCQLLLDHSADSSKKFFPS